MMDAVFRCGTHKVYEYKKFKSEQQAKIETGLGLKAWSLSLYTPGNVNFVHAFHVFPGSQLNARQAMIQLCESSRLRVFVAKNVYKFTALAIYDC